MAALRALPLIRDEFADTKRIGGRLYAGSARMPLNPRNLT